MSETVWNSISLDAISCWILWMQFRLPFPIFCPWNPSKTRPGSAGVRCLWRCWTAIRRNLANLMKSIEIPNIGSSPSRSSGQASLSSGRRPIGLSWRKGGSHEGMTTAQSQRNSVQNCCNLNFLLLHNNFYGLSTWTTGKHIKTRHPQHQSTPCISLKNILQNVRCFRWVWPYCSIWCPRVCCMGCSIQRPWTSHPRSWPDPKDADRIWGFLWNIGITLHQKGYR